MPLNDSYLALGDGVFLKELEFPAVYDTVKDELFEVDTFGFRELTLCNGTLPRNESRFPPDFLEYCLDEGVLVELPSPDCRIVKVGSNEVPSLRYLMLEVTDRCNLACRHCYLVHRPIDNLAFERPCIHSSFVPLPCRTK